MNLSSVSGTTLAVFKQPARLKHQDRLGSRRRSNRLIVATLVLGVAACSSSVAADTVDNAPPTWVHARATLGNTPIASKGALNPPDTRGPTIATTAPPTTITPDVRPGTTAPAPTATKPPPDPVPVVPRPGTTPYRLPVADVEAAGWGDTHSEYAAADIFLDCGAVIVAPVNGVVAESRRVDSYDPSVDNPATRGGRSVTLVGDDGIRYYLAHFERIEDGIEPGARVTIGQVLGEMGQTGRASACHLHFGISPPCPDKEWSVRRGAVWPFPYLDDWRNGGQRSPAAEIQQWVAEHPTACADAMADPHADDS